MTYEPQIVYTDMSKPAAANTRSLADAHAGPATFMLAAGIALRHSSASAPALRRWAASLDAEERRWRFDLLVAAAQQVADGLDSLCEIPTVLHASAWERIAWEVEAVSGAAALLAGIGMDVQIVYDIVDDAGTAAVAAVGPSKASAATKKAILVNHPTGCWWGMTEEEATSGLVTAEEEWIDECAALP